MSETASTAAERRSPSGEAVLVAKPEYLPALDGIRGLALIIMLLYHHGVTWVTGGELTVAMFFTLSGFLITRLLMYEWSTSQTLALRTFYERRVRRLFPTSFIVLSAVVVVWTLFPGSGRRLASGEWFSGLFYFENFYLQAAGKDYGNLFGLGNPVQHLWSLSLEEQVYILFPLLCLVFLKGRRHAAAAWRLFSVLAALTAAGLVLGVVYKSHSPFWGAITGTEIACRGSSCSYYALEVRSAEFFLGAAFAVLWAVWKQVPRLTEFLRRPYMRRLSWVLLAFEFWMWWEVGLRNDWRDVWFPWAVLVHGVLTLVLIAYAQAGVGMNRLLSWRPLILMGQTTYTVYLVHWPLFMLVESWRLDPNLPHVRIPGTSWVTVDNFWMFWFKIAFTYALVILIYRFIEDPVRRRERWKGRTIYPWLIGIALVGIVTTLVGADRRSSADDVMSVLDQDALEMQERAVAELPVLPADAPTRATADPDLPARVLFVGDSQSWVLASGLDDWEATNGVFLVPSPGVGCGVGRTTPIEYLGVEQEARPGCNEWRDALPAIVARLRPNLVVIVGGTADLSNRKIPGRDDWSHVGEPDYDAWLTAEMRDFLDVVDDGGARILWFTSPDVDPPYIVGETGEPPFDEADPARTARYNELISAVAADDPRVVVADFASAVRAHPGGQFETKMRPDGAHIDLKYAPELVEWIDAAIKDAYRD